MTTVTRGLPAPLPIESWGSPGRSLIPGWTEGQVGAGYLFCCESAPSCDVLGTQTQGLGRISGSISTGRLKHTICPNYRERDVCLIGTLDYFPKHAQVINFSRAGKVYGVISLLFTP